MAQRRAVLDDVKTITAYVQDMNRFLRKSELTERRAFIETFVREIELLPDNAVVRYTVPMPDDSLIPGEKAQEIPPSAYGGDHGVDALIRLRRLTVNMVSSRAIANGLNRIRLWARYQSCMRAPMST